MVSDGFSTCLFCLDSNNLILGSEAHRRLGDFSSVLLNLHGAKISLCLHFCLDALESN